MSENSCNLKTGQNYCSDESYSSPSEETSSVSKPSAGSELCPNKVDVFSLRQNIKKDYEIVFTTPRPQPGLFQRFSDWLGGAKPPGEELRQEGSIHLSLAQAHLIQAKINHSPEELQKGMEEEKKASAFLTEYQERVNSYEGVSSKYKTYTGVGVGGLLASEVTAGLAGGPVGLIAFNGALLVNGLGLWGISNLSRSVPPSEVENSPTSDETRVADISKPLSSPASEPLKREAEKSSGKSAVGKNIPETANSHLNKVIPFKYSLRALSEPVSRVKVQLIEPEKLRTELIDRATRYLLNPSEAEYGDFFAKAGILGKIDDHKEIPLSFFSEHLVSLQERWRETVSLSKRIVANESDPFQKMNKALAPVRKAYLELYVRFKASFPDVLDRLGGNCEARMIAILSLIDALKKIITLPPGWEIGVQNYTDHVEVVVYRLNPQSGKVEEMWELLHWRKIIGKRLQAPIVAPQAVFYAFLLGQKEKLKQQITFPVTAESLVRVDVDPEIKAMKAAYVMPPTDTKLVFPWGAGWSGDSPPPETMREHFSDSSEVERSEDELEIEEGDNGVGEEEGDEEEKIEANNILSGGSSNLTDYRVSKARLFSEATDPEEKKELAKETILKFRAVIGMRSDKTHFIDSAQKELREYNSLFSPQKPISSQARQYQYLLDSAGESISRELQSSTGADLFALYKTPEIAKKWPTERLEKVARLVILVREAEEEILSVGFINIKVRDKLFGSHEKDYDKDRKRAIPYLAAHYPMLLYFHQKNGAFEQKVKKYPGALLTFMNDLSTQAREFFFKSLSEETQRKVIAYAADPKKVSIGETPAEEAKPMHVEVGESEILYTIDLKEFDLGVNDPQASTSSLTPKLAKESKTNPAFLAHEYVEAPIHLTLSSFFDLLLRFRPQYTGTSDRALYDRFTLEMSNALMRSDPHGIYDDPFMKTYASIAEVRRPSVGVIPSSWPKDPLEEGNRNPHNSNGYYWEVPPDIAKVLRRVKIRLDNKIKK